MTRLDLRSTPHHQTLCLTEISAKSVHFKRGCPKVNDECKINGKIVVECVGGVERGCCEISYGNVFTLDKTQMLGLEEGL